MLAYNKNWIADDGDVAETGDLFDERQQLFGPQRAVEAEGRQRVMPDGGKEGFQGLACERPAGPVAGRDRYDDGKAFRYAADGVQGGLGVERVETRFDEQQVDATFDEGFDLFLIDGGQVVERQRPAGAVSQVGRQGQRLGRRPDAAGDPDLAARPVGFAAGDARAGACV